MALFREDAFAGVSGITSNAVWVGDAEEMTVFINIDSDTTIILEGSNATGFRTSIEEDSWSNLTTMASVSTNDLLNIEPGFRWLRGLRETASAASWAEMVVAGRNRVR